MDPADVDHLCGWGVALVKLARVASEASFGSGERSRLLILAGRKFRTAAELDPDWAFVWEGWAKALLDRSEDHFDMAERAKLLDQSRSRIGRAIALESDEGYFLLGRLEARQGRVEEAVAALRQWRKLDSSARPERIPRYSEFGDIDNHPAFRELMES